MLLVISYSQPTEKGLNHLRKLESADIETILIGFDNYNKTLIDNDQNYSLAFNTYFLLKNWNNTKINHNEIDFNDINISSFITYHKNEKKSNTSATFNCSIEKFYDVDEYENNYCDKYNPYCIVKYECSYNSSGILVPKKINLLTNFTNDISINNTKVSYVTTSAEAFKSDITSLNYVIDAYSNFRSLRNATFVSQSPYSFKIKGEKYEYYGDSNNIELITKQKKIPCVGKYVDRNYYDGLDDYYLLETKEQNYLANTDLRYAIANFSKAKENTMFILDFKDGVNSTIKDKINYKMSSGGLSTGGIVGVAVPSCAVLLGVAGLSFFLSRKTATPPPGLKNMNNMNMQNNTMGVITTSSEAIVHQ
jgi:hypothetical protein